MARDIVQTVRFAAKPAALFSLYMDSKTHAAATGGAARIGKKAGSAFTAWDGYIRGKTIHLQKDRLVVQTWRATDWKKSDPDSILLLTFTPVSGGTELRLVHAGVPDERRATLDSGWHEHYWKPWRRWLEARG